MNTCVIIGNGPSLATVPMQFLNSHDTFGANKIYLLDDFIPTYYSVVNPLVLKQCWHEISHYAAKTTAFFPRFFPYARLLAALSQNTHLFGTTGARVFCTDLSSLWWPTITYVNMQIAFALGYRRLLLVGVDHNYSTPGKPNEQVSAGATDPNHFHPKYFADGEQWHLPDLETWNTAYRIAKIIYERAGGEIINLTTSTQLDVFRKDDLEKWL